MKTDFDFIVRVLSHYQINRIQTNGACNDIRAVEFLTGAQTLLDPEKLYFGPSDAIKKFLPLRDTLNIVCLEDLSGVSMNIPYLNLLAIPPDLNVFTIVNEVQEALLKEKKFNLWSWELMGKLTDNEGIGSIARAGYEMLGNPICVSDSSFNAIAMISDREIKDDPVWNEYMAKGHLTYNTYSYYLKTDLSKYMESNNCTPFFWQDSYSKYRRVFWTINIDKELAGILTVLEYEKCISDDDLKLVSLLGNALSVEFQKNKYTHYTDKTLYRTILKGILSGKTSDKASIADKSGFLKIPAGADMYAVTIKACNVSAVPENHLESLCSTLEKSIKNSKALVYGGNIFMLAYYSKTISLFEEDFRILKEFLIENQLKAGVSNSLHSLEDLRKHYLQSLHALRLGKLFKDKNPIYFYEDYMTYYMLEVCSNDEKLKKYCHPSLSKLMDYDRQNNTSLTQTLYAFIRNSGSSTETANALKIHRSSLTYRLEKIREIMHIDLNNANILLLLHLSFKIIEYSNKTGI